MYLRDMDREARDLLHITLSEVIDMEQVKVALEESTLNELPINRKEELINMVEKYLQHKVDKC